MVVGLEKSWDFWNFLDTMKVAASKLFPKIIPGCTQRVGFNLGCSSHLEIKQWKRRLFIRNPLEILYMKTWWVTLGSTQNEV